MDGMGIGSWTHVWSDALHPGDEHDVEEAGDGEGGARKRREGVCPTYRDRDHKFVRSVAREIRSRPRHKNGE